MYLLWKKQQGGKLAISRSGLKEFLNQILPDGYKCLDANLLAETDEIVAVISIPEFHSSVELEMVKERVERALSDMAFKPRLSWTVEPPKGWLPAAIPNLGSPFFWGAAIALLALLIILGIEGIILVVVFGAAGLVISALVNYFRGSKSLKDIFSSFWR